MVDGSTLSKELIELGQGQVVASIHLGSRVIRQTFSDSSHWLSQQGFPVSHLKKGKAYLGLSIPEQIPEPKAEAIKDKVREFIGLKAVLEVKAKKETLPPVKDLQARSVTDEVIPETPARPPAKGPGPMDKTAVKPKPSQIIMPYPVGTRVKLHVPHDPKNDGKLGTVTGSHPHGRAGGLSVTLDGGVVRLLVKNDVRRINGD